MNVLVCIVLPNICIENIDYPVLISLLTKTAQKENSWNRLSGLNAADTSKRGAWL